MTDPTPTPQAPPQGLTEDTLREQWNAQADEFNQWESLDSAEQFAWAQKCAIAAHEAARVGLHCYLDDDGLCPSPCVFDDPTEQISDCTYAQGLQRDGEPKTSCPYYRTTPTPQTPPQGLTDERLLELAAGEIDPYDRIEPGEYEAENERAIEIYGSELIAAMRAAIAAHEAARPQLTPEEVAARFRAWWAESFPNAPAGPHAVASHVAFALHLLGGEVAA